MVTKAGFLFTLLNAFSCCVRFSLFFHTKPTDCMACGNVCEMTSCVVCRDGRKATTHSLTQSISQSLSVVSNLTQTNHQARTAVADAATRTHQVTRADNSSSTTSSVTSSRRGTDNHDVIVVRRARRSAKPRSDCVRACRCSVNAT